MVSNRVFVAGFHTIGRIVIVCAFGNPTNTSTLYSMNRLFSEFFKKFGGVFLEVFETI